jgi:superfamily I DNA/RNA helicase
VQVFVDETQDFTQAELTVLIRLAHNPNHMFLTGDTAQSIMRGVSFRFSDLKTLFHYAKQSLKARGKTGMLEVGICCITFACHIITVKPVK